MKFSTLSIILFLCKIAAIAQPELPATIPLHHPEDYINVEDLAVESMHWLIDHSIEEEPVLRSRLDSFCMEWLAGHPNLELNISSQLMPYASKHPLLLYVHCYGAALAIIEDAPCDRVCYNEAGVRAVLRNIGKTKGLTQCETLSQMILAADNNRLREWVESNLQP